MGEQLSLLAGDRPIYSHAVLSEDRRYRYALFRSWDEARGRVLFILLNPSTADEHDNDPTIRKCIAYAKRWGYGGIDVGNLYAYRATNPEELIGVPDPVGLLNDEWLERLVREATVVVCAWGRVDEDLESFAGRTWLVLHLLQCAGKKAHVLRHNKDGSPAHPLYLPGDLRPRPFVELAREVETRG
jgi:hypothetical protein